jgi:hypothetical protein
MASRLAAVTIVVSSLAWLAGTGMAAAQIAISGGNQRRTFECGGKNVIVSGSMNELTLRGECPRIDITGGGNTISVDQVGRIDITGAGNRVTWARALDGTRPRVSTTGVGNVITRLRTSSEESAEPAPAAPTAGEPADAKQPERGAGATATENPPVDTRADKPPAAKTLPDKGAATAQPPSQPEAAPRATPSPRPGPPIVFLEDEITRTIDCRNRDVDLRGDGNTLTLRGDCGKLLVTGNNNVIEIDSVQAIDTPGNENRITWAKGPSRSGPKITNLGNGNTIRKAGT